MSDKTTLMRGFNTHFFDFIEDIIRIFPEKKDISVSKTSFETIKMANPTALIKAWYMFIYSPYKSVIDAGDITFFFDKDYSEDLSHLQNSQKIMGIIDTLREPVKNMSDTNKEHSMKYIQNLSKLSMLYSQQE